MTGFEVLEVLARSSGTRVRDANFQLPQIAETSKRRAWLHVAHASAFVFAHMHYLHAQIHIESGLVFAAGMPDIVMGADHRLNGVESPVYIAPGMGRGVRHLVEQPAFQTIPILPRDY